MAYYQSLGEPQPVPSAAETDRRAVSFARRVFNKLTRARPRAHALFDSMFLSAEEAQARRSADPGLYEKLFFDHKGQVVHKWPHYCPVYDRVFGPWRGKPVKFLELGVFKGGSLQIAREVLGKRATIFGVDIEPTCVDYAVAPNQVRIGSQDDPWFLNSVVDEMGGLDIVLDDGSHMAAHQLASFKALWPRLRVGGTYIIEDAQTAYWPHMGGGYKRPGTAIELAKTLIDDMHGWHHLDGPGQVYAPPGEIGSVTVHDSIIVIEKVNRPRPGHFMVGDPALLAEAMADSKPGR